jgi:hypothetical protein
MSRIVFAPLVLLCGFFASLLHTSPLFAWGYEGHRITALMAQEILTKRAKAEVQIILEGGSLVDAAVYPDVFREALKREVPGSDKWHYDNRQVCRDSARGVDYCQDGNCASVQIPRLFSILADKSRSNADRQMALRFLVHIVGDIHQPLHASDDDDWGGNKKIVLLPGETPVPAGGDQRPRNLHLTWDVDFVKRAMSGLAEDQVAKYLVDNNWKKFPEWMRGDGDVWMAESFGLARRLVYGKLEGFACAEVDGKKIGTLNGKAWTDAPFQLSESYVSGAVAIVPPLLARAGARIGGLLNAALDPLPPGVKIPPPPKSAESEGKAAPAAASAPTTPAPPPTTSLRDALQREQMRAPSAPPPR